MEIQSQTDSTSTQDVYELHRRCCSTDPIICNAAFQQLGRFLLRIAHSHIGSQPHLAYVAEDATQQALVTIWQKLREGKGPNHVEWFLTWSASIVIHKVLDALRKLSRSNFDSLEALIDDNTLSPIKLSASDADAPDLQAMDAEGKVEFVGLIQNHPRLSTDAKIVILHGYLLELDDEALAQQLGKTRSNVRVLRCRGLKLLRDDHEFMSKVSALTLAEATS